MTELAARIFQDLRERLFRQTDRLFFWLFGAQWGFAIAIAVIRTPWTYTGADRALHPHVLIAIVLGAALCSFPVMIGRAFPGRAITRHLVAAVQMLWSGLIILLMGGRIEAHFHVFGSLAFLALYRDPRVLLTATLTIVGDHLARGLLWPDSVYGLANPEWWRFLEHATWVAFEDVVLVAGGTRAIREMRDAAIREAALEQTAASIQQQVEHQTRQLKQNAERYRLLVENTEAIPFEYDVNTRRVLYMAPKAAQLLECAPDDLLAEGIVEKIAHPDDRHRVRAAIAAFTRGERAASEPIDHRMMTTKGRTIHVRTFVSSNTGGRVRGIFLDLTRQAVLEQELRQAQKLESVGRLAAGVAHEINTPIQFVSHSLEFARDAMTELLELLAAQRTAFDAIRTGPWSAQLVDETARKLEAVDLPYLTLELPRALDRALEGAHRVEKIVRSMKVFAHDKREMTEVDLRTAIESTLEVARSEYKRVADLELVLEPVPRVTCVGSEINQVILNLVINAAQAIAEVVGASGERGKITVALRQLGDAAQISVSDTGGGIPEAARDHIFEQFYTTKPVGQGTGQSLALCRSVIVDKHHGALTFETRLGAGTTFHVRLPLAPALDKAS
jgi:PAS domain S-box-containing protein